MILILIFTACVAQTLSKDPGSSWLHTSFNPFTYANGNPVLDDENYTNTDAQGFLSEPKHVRDISSRKTWLSQTFREITNIEEFYNSNTMKVNVGGLVWKFSGSYDQTRTHTHNHTTMYLSKLYVGEAQVTTKQLLSDLTTKRLTKTWQTKFDHLFATASKIPEMCPSKHLKPECAPWYASLDQIYKMVNEAGWIVSGVRLGGSASMRVSLRASDVSDMTSDQISQAIGASIGGWVSGGYSSVSDSEHITKVSKAITNVDMNLIGGEGIFNSSFTEFLNWEKTLATYPDVFGVDLVPLYSLVNSDRFPEYSSDLVEFVRSQIKFAYDKLVEMNTPLGCNSFREENFNPNSFSYGGCEINANYTFGGFVQLSTSDNSHCQSSIGYSQQEICPPGWKYLSVSGGNISLPEIDSQQKCFQILSLKVCKWYQIPYVCTIDSGICISENSSSTSFNMLFGGIFSSQEPNPLTGNPSCPPGFNAISLLNGFLIGCQKFPGDENDKYAVPFGGIYSGISSNSLTNQSGCPSGHSRYFLGSFNGIPWYSCMAYRASYMASTFKYLPNLIDEYTITYKNRTVVLTNKSSVSDQISFKISAWKIYVPILSSVLAILLINIGFLIRKKYKKETVESEAVSLDHMYLRSSRSKSAIIDENTKLIN